MGSEPSSARYGHIAVFLHSVMGGWLQVPAGDIFFPLRAVSPGLRARATSYRFLLSLMGGGLHSGVTE